MLDVVSLQYGTAFKKAFGDSLVFSAFVHDVLGIEFHTDRVEQEHGFRPVYGHVDIKYDLFAEDVERRIIVELQHIREDDSFDRFLYYHLIGQAEQIQNAENYRFPRTVYTLVVLTRQPKDPSLRFDMAFQDSDLQDLQGRALNVYRHRLVFINARGLRPDTPAPLRRWLELIEDSLDQKVDETNYPEAALRTIERTQISSEEAFRLKEEASWESAKRQASQEGEARGEARGKADGLLAAVLTVCELLELAPSGVQRARLEAMEVADRETFLHQLKQMRHWPA